MQTNPPSASSASCDTKAYASASSPTPRTPSQKQSVAPNGGAFFDFFAFSCDYGICKPSRGIYRDVLHRLGTPVEDVAFIDDRRENVRAAELMGVKGILWTGPEQAEARLKELGFLF